MALFRWSTLSFSHRRRDLPGEPSPRSEQPKTSLSRQFEQQGDPMKAAQRSDLRKPESERRDIAALAREKRLQRTSSRQSDMVANDRPIPVLKPSPQMAHAVDAARFNGKWRAEERAAMRAQLAQSRDELKQLQPVWENTLKTISAADETARMGDPKRASRDAFKAFRRAEMQSKSVLDRSSKTLARGKAFVEEGKHLAAPDVTTNRNPSRGERG